MTRKTIARIDLSAIKHNYLYAKSLVPNAQAIAIVKANAYGHGAVEVSQALDDSVDALGVACLEEALLIRAAGVKSEILLLEGVFEEGELSIAADNLCMLVVATERQVEWLLNLDISHQFDVFIKYDAGMGRLGFQQQEIISVFNRLSVCKCVKSVTLMSHFCCADELESDITQQQIAKVRHIYDHLEHPEKVTISVSNSAGILSKVYPEQHYIRPGIMLYGAEPMPCRNELKPTMSVTAPIISLKIFQQGESIGYGSTYICDKETLIAVVAIGYADGYPRHAKTGMPVFVNGIRAYLVGRVSMDMITIDVTEVTDVKLADRVELFGDNILINELAENAQTISYEIFTKITSRVHKEYYFKHQDSLLLGS